MREGKKCTLLILITQVFNKCKIFTPADYNIDNTSNYKSLITPGTYDLFKARCRLAGQKHVICIHSLHIPLLGLPETPTNLVI
jgi:hypothetical protein